MKITCLFIFLLFQLSSFIGDKNVTLKVEVIGFPSDEGSAFVAVYNSPKGFLDTKFCFSGKILKVNNGKVMVNFGDLPVGKYAIAVFHDKNENGILDKNIFGVPTESYRFSKNVEAIFRAPYFEEVAVGIYSSQTLVIEIE